MNGELLKKIFKVSYRRLPSCGIRKVGWGFGRDCTTRLFFDIRFVYNDRLYDSHSTTDCQSLNRLET